MKKAMGISILSMVFLFVLLVSGALAIAIGMTTFSREDNTYRQGMDYYEKSMTGLDYRRDIEDCERLCKNDTQCKAFTFQKAIFSPLMILLKPGRCMLKNGVPPPQPATDWFSGVKSQFVEPNVQQMPKPKEGQTRTLAGGVAGGIADGYQVMPGNTGGQTPGDSGNPNVTILACPANVSVSNIEITPGNISPKPGFVGMYRGNVPATFKFLRTGKSEGGCYCEYELGELFVRIQAVLTGYTKCDVTFDGKIQLFK